MGEEHRREAHKKLTVPDLIDQSARAAAKEVVRQQRRARGVNLYRAMERLLRAYPRRLRLAEHPEEYEFFPAGRSKDISIAPPPGIGVVDKVQANELFVEARKRAFENEMTRLYETEYAMAPFVHLPEFVVIRMYYFGEDVHGQPREPGAHRWTFEEIASELSSIGVERSVQTLCMWRSRLVQDMTVMLFGVDGAVSVETREPKREEGGQ